MNHRSWVIPPCSCRNLYLGGINLKTVDRMKKNKNYHMQCSDNDDNVDVSLLHCTRHHKSLEANEIMKRAEEAEDVLKTIKRMYGKIIA